MEGQTMSRRSEDEHQDRIHEAEAADLRAQGLSYRQIAARVGVSVDTAHRRVWRYYQRLPVHDVAAAKAKQIAQLEELQLVAWKVLEEHHFVVITSGPAAGEIVRGPRLDPDGQESGEYGYLEDGAVILQAIDTIVRIDVRLSRLLGTEAPARHRVEVITRDVIQASLEKMRQEMAELGVPQNGNGKPGTNGHGPGSNGHG
jgi:Homeodomain-like domain